jgi:DNA-binding CsgD family transcriptional regulator
MTARRSPLSRRQREVLTLAANGNTAAQIGAWLWVTPDTVNTTLQNAYRNLGVHDRAHAVAVAIRLGLIDLEAVTIPDRLADGARSRREARQNAA